MSIYSPLDQFNINDIMNINIFSYHISLTNLGMYTNIVIIIALALHILGYNKRIVPSKWSISLESGYATMNTMVKEQLGTEKGIYLPFIYSLFIFIILINLMGNIPYSFAISASGIVSIGLSLTIFLGVTILGLYLNKLSFFSFFVPTGTPIALVPLLVLIELISYLARSVSLGLRLFSNIAAGHILVKILSTFLYQLFSGSLWIAVLTVIPFAIFIAILGLELAVSIIQAYVWTVLSLSYLKDSIDLH